MANSQNRRVREEGRLAWTSPEINRIFLLSAWQLLCQSSRARESLEIFYEGADHEPNRSGGSGVTQSDAKLESLLRRAAGEVLAPNGAAERLTVLVTRAGEWHCWFRGGERVRTEEEKASFLIRVKKVGNEVSTVSDIEVDWGGTRIACRQVAGPAMFPLGEWLSPARVRLVSKLFQAGWLTPQTR